MAPRTRKQGFRSIELEGRARRYQNYQSLRAMFFHILTFQIVCIHKHTSEQQMKYLKVWAMDCLKPKTGRREEEGRERTALMVVKFGPGCRTVKVENYPV